VEVQLRWVEVVSWTSQSLHCQRKNPNYLWKTRLAGPRTDQEALKEKQLLTLTRIQPRFLGFPAHEETGKVVFPYHLQN
jgi:hypothetical protein